MTEPDWARAANLAERELARIDAIALETVARIRDELPDFLLVPVNEHVESVREQLRRRLDAFRERRAWDPGDLDQAVRLAQRRARQGISVDALISAFHVGDRELWRNLSRDPGPAAPLLPELTSLMLESMQAVSTSLAAAHSRETRERDRVHISVSQRFIELLLASDHGAELSRLAEYLGFDEAATHVAVAFTSSSRLQMGIEDPIMRRLEGFDMLHARAGETYLALLRGPNALARAREAFTSDNAQVRAGIGCEHPGLAGATRSLRQAQSTLAIASASANIREFARDWHWCGHAAINPLLESEALRAVDIARSQAHLCETVRAYAAADMSKVKCARESHLHQNTVAYRLDRWTDLTGWDPRTFDGLVRSIAACTVAELG
ncbi:helix-turn-helix domain-containing protein [Nocardia sp. NPDC049707]|uniref:PucR family transcriptional regulator n=1 Tax=Nocardia sp. NPDC049707 TaxID=3154735 RepID=UPI0034434FCA